MASLRMIGAVLALTLVVGAACTSDEDDPVDGTATGSPTATATGDASPTATTPPDDDAGADLELIADDLIAPVHMAYASDDTDRLFIVEQTGTIRIVDADGELADEPFLDISDRLVEFRDSYDERGLLGLAFHPDYASNGRFYVYYSAPLREGAPADWDHTSHVSEFTVSADDPGVADAATERVLMEIDQPQFNHNGGHIAFGPDGYLYIPLGDGGAGNDVGLGHNEEIGNAQDRSNWLGSILRIDVDSAEVDAAYGIPADNPFLEEEGVLPEIWAYGLRNPYDIGFDSGGEYGLLISDAGQALFEEVSLASGGENFGWNILEGTHCFDPADEESEPAECEATGAGGEALVGPVVEYHRSDFGTTVTGARIYRGSALPAFAGMMIFVDWTAGPSIYAALPGDGMAATGLDEGLWDFDQVVLASEFANHITGIAEGPDGELYIMSNSEAGPVEGAGQVHRLVPAD